MAEVSVLHDDFWLDHEEPVCDPDPDSTDFIPSYNPAIDAYISGIVGGFTGCYAGQPLDIIKTRLQVANAQYNGSLRTCFSVILKNEGILGFWAGVTAPLAGMMAVNGIIFGVEKQAFSCMPSSDNRAELIMQHCGAGAVAGAAQTVIASPTELIKCRMQMQAINSDTSNKYKNVFDGLRTILRREGVRALMLGFSTTLLREIPAFSVYFGTYYWLETHPDYGFSAPSCIDEMFSADMAKLMVAGGLAGQASWTISYPVDVLKTRIQLDGLSKTRKYSGLVDCFKKSCKADGVRWAYQGLLPALLRAFPSNAITFSFTVCTFELLSKLHD